MPTLDDLLTQLAPLGDISAQKMFGAYGLRCDGHFFAIFEAGELYLYADDALRPAFETAGMEPFTYMRDGIPTTMRYYRIALEDPALLARAEASIAARRTNPVKPHRSHHRPRP